MDTNLIIAYASLFLAFLGFAASLLKTKTWSKALLIVVSVLMMVSVTFVLWRPLRDSVREAFSFPDGIQQTDEKAERRDAWGPQDRQMYTWERPANCATFNSMLDNPSLGHETNFVRVREANTGTYTNDIIIEAGKEYEVFVYYHNNGDPNLKSEVMSYNTRIKMNFPTEMHANHAGEVKGTITWTDTTANTHFEVWDTAYLHTKSDVVLMYVPNSAVLHNGSEGEYSTNDTVLHSESFFGEGAKIAYDNRYWGIIPAGTDYAGYVVFRIKVESGQS